MKSGKKIAVISLLMMSLLLPSTLAFANTVPDNFESAGAEDNSLEGVDSRNDDPELWKLQNRASLKSTYAEQEHPDSYYVHDERFDGFLVEKGADISEFQGSSIDYDKVKSDGIDFVIIRIAYRGYGEQGNIRYDAYYEQNIKAAKAAGLDVGIYFFSQAISEEEAREEARYCIDAAKRFGITMPLVMDYEFAYDSNGTPGRLAKRAHNGTLSRQDMTDICNAFSSEIKSAGYTPMIYADLNMLTNYLYNASVSANADVWLAQWNKNTTYSGEYYYWQYTNYGVVEGINARVDKNFRYVKPLPGKTNNLRMYNKASNSYWFGWDSAENADGYIMYRSEGDNDNYEKIATVSEGRLSYADYDLEHGKTYHYYVRSYNNIGGTYYYGEKSNECSIKVNFVPGATENVRVYNKTSNSYWLGWDSAENADGYVVYRSEGNTNNFEKIETVTEGRTSFADYDIEHGKTYYYYVRSYHGVNGFYYYGKSSDTLKVKITL